MLFRFLSNCLHKIKTSEQISYNINLQLTSKCFKFIALGTEYIHPLYYLGIPIGDMIDWVSFLPGTDA